MKRPLEVLWDEKDGFLQVLIVKAKKSKMQLNFIVHLYYIKAAQLVKIQLSKNNLGGPGGPGEPGDLKAKPSDKEQTEGRLGQVKNSDG